MKILLLTLLLAIPAHLSLAEVPAKSRQALVDILVDHASHRQEMEETVGDLSKRFPEISEQLASWASSMRPRWTFYIALAAARATPSKIEEIARACEDFVPEGLGEAFQKELERQAHSSIK